MQSASPAPASSAPKSLLHTSRSTAQLTHRGKLRLVSDLGTAKAIGVLERLTLDAAFTAMSHRAPIASAHTHNFRSDLQLQEGQGHHQTLLAALSMLDDNVTFGAMHGTGTKSDFRGA